MSDGGIFRCDVSFERSTGVGNNSTMTVYSKFSLIPDRTII